MLTWYQENIYDVRSVCSVPTAAMVGKGGDCMVVGHCVCFTFVACIHYSGAGT